MMKQQRLSKDLSQGNHPIETAIKELISESWELFLQRENLHQLIIQQLRTAQNQQARAQLIEILKFLRQYLPDVTVGHLHETIKNIIWNRGRNLLNGIAEYKKLIENQAEDKIKGTAKANIENMATDFKNDISSLKRIVEKLQEGASSLKQELQNLQSSAQQQETASVVQQAVSAIDNIFNAKIASILNKLSDLESILGQIQKEVEQLGQQREPSDGEGGTNGSASTSSEQEPSKQAFELEDKILDLYRAVIALEIVVNTAIENAGIIPKKFKGIDTYTVSRDLRSINYKNLNAALTFLEKYTGRSRPSLLAALSSAKQGNATQPHFLKQQQAAPSDDIPEGIKIYLENFKTFLVDVRNQVRKNLEDISREVSEFGNNIDQISDMEEKVQAQKVCSIPTFIILGTCASKLDDELSPSVVEAAAPVLGAIIIAQSIWSSLLREDGWAEQVLQEIVPQFQDPEKQEGLHNILVVLAHRRQEARGETPPRVAEEVGATVLGAIGAFVQPAVKQLRQGTPSHKGKKLRRVLLVTNTTLVRDTLNQTAEEKEIPTLTEGGIVKNTKEMINALVKFMLKYWESIMQRINNDINAGRFSKPGDLKAATEEVNKAWQALRQKMSSTKWKEEYSYDATREKKKIEEIKAELENLLNAWFNLFEKWKAAGPKLEAGALNLEYLLFHPLGLPALRIALTTLPASISLEDTVTATATTTTATEGPTTNVRTATQEQEADQKGPEQSQEQPNRPRKRLKGGGSVTTQHQRTADKKETTGKEISIAITLIKNAIEFINKGQVEGALNAVANAINILTGTGRQKPQPQGALPEHLRNAVYSLSMARLRLSEASQSDPKSEAFKTRIDEARSFLQHALKNLQNPTGRLTPYLGRNLLLLMKALRSVPPTAQSHRQRVKNEDTLEKETI